jgi:signal transduction histidine kinase
MAVLSKYKSLEQRPLTVPFIIFTIILVTILDFETPLGISAWIFFAIPLLIVYLGTDEKYLYPVFYIIAAIIIIDSFFKTSIGSFNIAVINRGSGILIFLALTVLFKRQKKTYRELYNLNITLEDRVKERTEQLELSSNILDKLNKDLEDKVIKLNESNSELETFAYSISHDLRAPIRLVYGNAELLESLAAEKLDEQSRHHLELVLKSSLHLSDLIEDLLTYTSMGRMEMHPEIVDMNILFKEVISNQQDNINKTLISWQQDNLSNAYGDHSLLKILAESLVSNAIKSVRTIDNPKIVIGFKEENNKESIFYIRDNGIGFNMEESDKLFNVFQKLHKQAEFEGTGLGLAIVKRIIQRHQGRVWAESKPREGATFYFALPKIK